MAGLADEDVQEVEAFRARERRGAGRVKGESAVLRNKRDRVKRSIRRQDWIPGEHGDDPQL